jgi:hypothetical protein
LKMFMNMKARKQPLGAAFLQRTKIGQLCSETNHCLLMRQTG